jgi:hypothetical protein
MIFVGRKALPGDHAELRYVEVIFCGALSPEALGLARGGDGGGDKLVVSGDAGEGFACSRTSR